jgi:hypothetical protein
MSLFDFIKDRCVIEGDCWNWQGAWPTYAAAIRARRNT